MVGDAHAAEDVVQEAWLRLRRVDPVEIHDLRAWLSLVVRRLALDALGSARRRREQYVGLLPPEGAAGIDDGHGPERAIAVEQAGAAVGIVLENLSPSERAPFLLHDVFGLEFTDVARLLGRTPQACRQLAVRGRRRLLSPEQGFPPDSRHRKRVVGAFIEACADGDLRALLDALPPEPASS